MAFNSRRPASPPLPLGHSGNGAQRTATNVSSTIRMSPSGAFDTLPDIMTTSSPSRSKQPTLRELTDVKSYAYIYNSSRANRYANTSAAELLGSHAANGLPSPGGANGGNANGIVGGVANGGVSSAAFPSLYRGPKDHPLRSRHRMGLGTVDEDPGVKLLEARLKELAVTRTKKLAALEKKNEEMIARDIKRHEWFKSEFKSEEELEAQRLEELKVALQKRLDRLAEEEAIERAFEEEEESYEYRNELSMLHLSIYSTTVAMVTAENERKQNQLKLIEEEEQRKLDTHLKLLELFVKEAFETKRETERAEHNDRKIITQQYQSAQLSLQNVIRSRKQADFSTLEREREREQELREIAKAQELIDAEAALEERMRRLDARCKRINSQ